MSGKLDLSGLPEGPWGWTIHDHSLATLHDKQGADFGHILSIGPCAACAKRAAGEWKWGRCTTPPEPVARAIASIPDMVQEIERLKRVVNFAISAHDCQAEDKDTIAAWYVRALDEVGRLRARNAELEETSEAGIQRAAVAVARGQGCGLMVGEERVLCCDPRADEECRLPSDDCDCLAIARGVIKAFQGGQ